MVVKSEGKKHFGIPTYGWEDFITMNLKELDIRVWTGLIWLMIVTSSGLL
jgi:hypothetical protein